VPTIPLVTAATRKCFTNTPERDWRCTECSSDSQSLTDAFVDGFSALRRLFRYFLNWREFYTVTTLDYLCDTSTGRNRQQLSIYLSDGTWKWFTYNERTNKRVRWICSFHVI